MATEYEEELEKRCQELEENLEQLTSEANGEVSKLRDIIKDLYSDVNGIKNASRIIGASPEASNATSGMREIAEELDKFHERWRDTCVEEVTRWNRSTEFPFGGSLPRQYISPNVSIVERDVCEYTEGTYRITCNGQVITKKDGKIISREPADPDEEY